MLDAVRHDIKHFAKPEKAALMKRFFKTGKGEYGEGDEFLGLTVPECRIVAEKHKALPIEDLTTLLHSLFHEERFIALVIMVAQYATGSDVEKKKLYEFYLSQTTYINNWDLIDSSADKIIGEYVYAHDPKVLVKLAKSRSIWERRIAILSTFAFIKRNESEMTFVIADILLHDHHDLIHKAVGWLLREVGKRVDQKAEEDFLKTRYKTMPRTMLRYAIERFSPERRKQYLLGQI